MPAVAMIVGLGSAGRRHAWALKACDPDLRVVAVSRQSLSAEHVDSVVPTLAAGLEQRPNIAIIAGPATSRMPDALKVANTGAHLFLEKPVAADLNGISELETCAAEGQLIVAVGYNLRFFPPLNRVKSIVESGFLGAIRNARVEVGQYLPDWRPDSDYRRSVSARADLGGGALLELSHELDFIHWIVDKPASVWATCARLGDLDVTVEDSVELVLTCRSGAIVSVHMDMLQRPARRHFRLVGSEGTLELDLLTGRMQLSSDKTLEPGSTEQLDASLRDTYRDQIGDFLEAVSFGRPPRVRLSEGVAVLETICAARSASSTGCAVPIRADIRGGRLA